eukprot:768322-Amphidinium_carterae.1
MAARNKSAYAALCAPHCDIPPLSQVLITRIRFTFPVPDACPSPSTIPVEHAMYYGNQCPCISCTYNHTRARHAASIGAIAAQLVCTSPRQTNG